MSNEIRDFDDEPGFHCSCHVRVFVAVAKRMLRPTFQNELDQKIQSVLGKSEEGELSFGSCFFFLNVFFLIHGKTS